MSCESDFDSDTSSHSPKQINGVTKLNQKFLGMGDFPEPVMRLGTRTIFTHGRPPWYDAEGQAQQPLVIGICGGSGSGKTTVSRAIIESLDIQWVSMLSMDSYYKVLNDDEKAQCEAGDYDFDHPTAIDFELLEKHLIRLCSGKSIEVPEYDFKTHSRTSKFKTLYGANVIIIEGLLSLYYPSITKLMDLKVFVDTDADERLARRLRRDISNRGRTLSDVFIQYMRFVKPAYEQFIAPCMSIADIILPRGGQNLVGLQVLVQHITKRLKNHGLRLRHELVKFSEVNGNNLHFNNSQYDVNNKDLNYNHQNGLDFCFNDDLKLPPSVYVLPASPQTIGLHTLIRDKQTDQDSFVFYSERLMRLLCEAAMNLLPHMEIDVETSEGGVPYRGCQLVPGTEVCGVSILRSGEALEPALCAVCKDVRLGKILIQTSPVTCEPELYYIRLPRNIKNSFVILMDTTVATGAAAIMAMRILVEHDVPEDRIILISLIMARQGAYSVAYTYPKAHILTTAVDSGLNESYHIIPGVGNFGDRYFGTTPID